MPKPHRRKRDCRRHPPFPSTDADAFRDLRHENLPISSRLAGACSPDHCRKGIFQSLIADDHFDFYPGDIIRSIGMVSINLKMAFALFKTADFGNRHSPYADTSQCITDVIQLEWSDNGGNPFHDGTSYMDLRSGWAHMGRRVKTEIRFR